MNIRLGIDLGTTYTSASISRGESAEVIQLETGSTTMPSVVAFDGETVLTGIAAERRLAESPASGAREFKRRLGDTTPFILDGTPYGAEALTGHLVRSVVDRVGSPVDTVCLAHPANWGEYKLELLRDAGRLADVSELELIAEPVAAAMHYAVDGSLEPGAVVAVYDFGGGTFDTAVVRMTPSGAELLGSPEGLERLGGVDIDQMVLAHVDASLDGALASADTTNPETLNAIVALRRACSDAKEALSTDTDTSVPVRLPGLNTEVRITRAELESVLAPRIDDTLAALDRSLAAANVLTDDLAGVLLVGGTSRIPAVAERIASHTGRPTLTDADHISAVALGAATGTPATTKSDATVGSPSTGTSQGVSKKPAAREASGTQPTRLGTVGRAAAAVGAIGAAGAGGYGGWRYFRDDDGEHVEEDVVELTSATLAADPRDDQARIAMENAPPELSELAFLNDLAAAFTPTPQGQVAAAVFQAAATRPAAPPPAPARSAASTATTQVDAPAAPSPQVSPIVSNPQVETVRNQLRSRLEALAVPEGASEEDVAQLREDLDGLLDRFQPYPAQPTDDAVAALKYEFEDRVRDFAQDQRIEAVVDEQRRQVAEAEATEQQLGEFRNALRERLDQWSPPEGANAEEVAELRATLEGMIERAEAYPGQDAEDAMADLRLRFNDQVGDFAQDLKIDALVEAERTEETDDDGGQPDEPGTDAPAENLPFGEYVYERADGSTTAATEPAAETPAGGSPADNDGQAITEGLTDEFEMVMMTDATPTEAAAPAGDVAAPTSEPVQSETRNEPTMTDDVVGDYDEAFQGTTLEWADAETAPTSTGEPDVQLEDSVSLEIPESDIVTMDFLQSPDDSVAGDTTIDDSFGALDSDASVSDPTEFDPLDAMESDLREPDVSLDTMDEPDWNPDDGGAL